MAPHNSLLSILSCNPHFSFTASFTEHTRGSGEEKTQQKTDAEGKEKRGFMKSRNKKIDQSRLTVEPPGPDLARFLQNR